MRPTATHLLTILLALGACSNQTEAGGVAVQASLESEDDRILYALGQILGRDISGPISGADLSPENLDRVLLGVSDAVQGRESQVDLDVYGPMVQGFMQVRIAAVADGELAASMEFLAEQAALDGARETDSGIVIQQITAGDGAQPTADDVVEVHYHGTLRDGTVFDSSVDRGEPATFPLGQVIPCWTEGVQTMRVGGQSRLVCPPDLAYGSSSPPGIPPNSALVFEVELLSIVEE